MPLNPIELRHTLHQTPELMFQEYETTAILLENISSMENISIHRPVETGLLVEYKFNEGNYLLFRADIDALPIKEETESAFASKSNFMHACGHDVHTSILYGFLEYIVKNKINQNILFLFQPAEEGGGGAEKIIHTGVLNKFNIKNAFALHVTDEHEKGTVASTAGVLFASSCEVDVEFFGKSTHVAFPEKGKNAFEALTLFLDELRLLIAELPEKVVFGYGKICAGTVRNIVPDYAKIEATIRTLRRNLSEQFFQKLIFLLEDIKESTGVKYKITQGALYTEVVVDEALYKLCKEILSRNFSFIDCGSKMTGEDFGFISKLYPSFMFWLGTRTNGQHGLHNSKFLPDDSIIEIGIGAFKIILKGLCSN
jgi:N-acetyldiaminopimelate deacetylase